MALSDVLYGAYERRLARRLGAGAGPRHVGVMLDGNRRWARANGFEVRDGHQAGADKIKDLLHWCEDAGVEVVTLWLLSTDNLDRSQEEIVPLLQIIETAVADLAAEHRWRLHPIGALDLLPGRDRPQPQGVRRGDQGRAGTARQRRRRVRRATGDRRRGPLDAAAAVGRRPSVETIAENVSVEEIEGHLYTKGQPDPDLVIRTSGEQRLGRLPAVAEREVGVLLLRGLLARLPARRLPPRPALLRRTGAPRSVVEPGGRHTKVRGAHRANGLTLDDTPRACLPRGRVGRTVRSDAGHPSGVRGGRPMEQIQLRAEGRNRLHRGGRAWSRHLVRE